MARETLYFGCKCGHSFQMNQNIWGRYKQTVCPDCKTRVDPEDEMCDTMYCPNPDCGAFVLVDVLSSRQNCPKCGVSMDYVLRGKCPECKNTVISNPGLEKIVCSACRKEISLKDIGFEAVPVAQDQITVVQFEDDGESVISKYRDTKFVGKARLVVGGGVKAVLIQDGERLGVISEGSRMLDTGHNVTDIYFIKDRLPVMKWGVSVNVPEPKNPARVRVIRLAGNVTPVISDALRFIEWADYKEITRGMLQSVRASAEESGGKSDLHGLIIDVVRSVAEGAVARWASEKDMPLDNVSMAGNFLADEIARAAAGHPLLDRAGIGLTACEVEMAAAEDAPDYLKAMQKKREEDEKEERERKNRESVTDILQRCISLSETVSVAKPGAESTHWAEYRVDGRLYLAVPDADAFMNTSYGRECMRRFVGPSGVGGVSDYIVSEVRAIVKSALSRAVYESVAAGARFEELVGDVEGYKTQVVSTVNELLLEKGLVLRRFEIVEFVRTDCSPLIRRIEESGEMRGMKDVEIDDYGYGRDAEIRRRTIDRDFNVRSEAIDADEHAAVSDIRLKRETDDARRDADRYEALSNEEIRKYRVKDELESVQQEMETRRLKRETQSKINENNAYTDVKLNDIENRKELSRREDEYEVEMRDIRDRADDYEHRREMRDDAYRYERSNAARYQRYKEDVENREHAGRVQAIDDDAGMKHDEAAGRRSVYQARNANEVADEKRAGQRSQFEYESGIRRAQSDQARERELADAKASAEIRRLERELEEERRRADNEQKRAEDQIRAQKESADEELRERRAEFDRKMAQEKADHDQKLEEAKERYKHELEMERTRLEMENARAVHERHLEDLREEFKAKLEEQQLLVSYDMKVAELEKEKEIAREETRRQEIGRDIETIRAKEKIALIEQQQKDLDARRMKLEQMEKDNRDAQRDFVLKLTEAENRLRAQVNDNERARINAAADVQGKLVSNEFPLLMDNYRRELQEMKQYYQNVLDALSKKQETPVLVRVDMPVSQPAKNPLSDIEGLISKLMKGMLEPSNANTAGGNEPKKPDGGREPGLE